MNIMDYFSGVSANESLTFEAAPAKNASTDACAAIDRIASCNGDIRTVSFNDTPVEIRVVHVAPTLHPECIMTNQKKNGLYTTVKWNDGTYTTVKASCDDAKEPSVYMAFCAALAKKIYGSNAAVHRTVNRSTKEYLDAVKAKEAAEKRAAELELEEAAHERALLREAKRLRLKAEAKAYNAAHRLDEE